MESSWDYVQTLIAHVSEHQPPIRTAMENAVSVLSPNLSPKTIELVSAYDFDKLEAKLLAHLALAIRNEPPPEDTTAFFLGMFDRASRLRRKSSHSAMYICGSDRFATDDDGEWACGPIWFPKYRYFPHTLLKQLSRREGRNKLDTGYLLCQTFAAAFALRAAPMLARSVPAERHPVPVACGHDAGGMFVVCHATPDGIMHP
jgi:hypothetical protein